MGIKLQEIGKSASVPERREFFFWCDGCQMRHSIKTYTTGSGPHPCWDWNGSMETPTFNPSYLILGSMEGVKRCHSFIRNGRIEYCEDSEHHLKGQSVELKDLEAWRDE